MCGGGEPANKLAENGTFASAETNSCRVTRMAVADVVLDAIRRAIDKSAAGMGLAARMRLLREAYASLTPREREVMDLVVSGRLNKQIGGTLGISEITVKAHRGNLMRKIQADSLADLVNMAAALGLTASRRS